MVVKTERSPQKMRVGGTDIEIVARVVDGNLKIELRKAGATVHRVVLEHATEPLEHSWLIDYFAAEERVGMRELAHQVDEYVVSLNTNQG